MATAKMFQAAWKAGLSLAGVLYGEVLWVGSAEQFKNYEKYLEEYAGQR